MAGINEDVQYTLSLKDMLTGKLKQADGEAKKLETTFGGLKTVIGGVGIALGTIAVGDFLRESVSMFNDSSQASAQLDASLRSTANAAHLNRQALDAQAESLMNVSLFDDDAITGSQALLATFTKVKDAIYMDAIPAITDLATKMGGDLQGATIQVGKALNDPIKGITALTRVGVSFTEQQKETIKGLVETGRSAEAQRIILNELNKEFGGSAAAAAAAGTGPLTVFQNQIGNIREELGGLIVDLISYSRPALDLFKDGLQGIVNVTRSAIEWSKEHADGIKAVVGGLLVAGGVLLAYEGYLIGVAAAQGALTFATAAWTTVNQIALAWDVARAEGLGVVAAAQWALNVAMEANPIGLLIAGIAALAAGLIYAYEKSETFRAIIWGLWEVVKTVSSAIGNAFMGVGKIILGAVTVNPSMIADGWHQLSVTALDKGREIAGAFGKGYQGGLADFAADQVEQTAGSNEFAKDKGKGILVPGEPGADGKDISPKKATANKAVTVNISINNLIEQFKVQTTTINESLPKIQTAVANTLVKAVNDANLVADI